MMRQKGWMGKRSAVEEFKDNDAKVASILDYILISFSPARGSFLTTGACHAQFTTPKPPPLRDNAFMVLIS